MASPSVRALIHGFLFCLASACSTVESGECAECEAAPDLSAPVACTSAALACADGGASLNAQICRYSEPVPEGTTLYGYVKASGRTVSCGLDDVGCVHALARLKVNLCAYAAHPCIANPCTNGGTCVEIAGGFGCNCAYGFTGPTCAFDIDECATNDPCLPGERCFNTVGSYNCSCPPGWTGAGCADDVDECAGNPCLNGGTCTNEPRTYRCACIAGVSGPSCEYDDRVCLGTAVACSSQGSGCANSTGCTAGLCTGTTDACSSYSYSYCPTTTGCYKTYDYRCAGTRYACANAYDSGSCGTLPGCSWSPSLCRGNVAPCYGLVRSQCTSTPGCYLGVYP